MTSPVKAMVRSSYPTELKPQIAQPDYRKGVGAAINRRSYEHTDKIKQVHHLMNQLASVIIAKAAPGTEADVVFEEEEKPKVEYKDEDLYESDTDEEDDDMFEDDDEDEDGDMFEDEESGKK